MSYSILLYGATGFSGRLIAARGKNMPGDCRLILAARDGSKLRKVADQNNMEFRVFALDDHNEICNHIDDIDVIINAAGPFASTAMKLVAAALHEGCNYVDINGELDVYRQLDDLARKAVYRGITLVCGAGASAAGPDVLLDLALQDLKRQGRLRTRHELGAVRMATSQVVDFSRGTAATALRLLREQVLVVRKGESADAEGNPKKQMVVWHEPIGRLERSFNFSDPPARQKQTTEKTLPGIASAANLVDTPTALHTIVRHGLTARAIESYVETGPVGRFAYHLGGMLSPLLALPWASRFTRAQVQLLPEGLTQKELTLADERGHVVILEIEDADRTPLVDWRLKAPNVYTFTAQLVLPVACQVARGRGAKHGWITPSEALGLPSFAATGPLEGCNLTDRLTNVQPDERQ